MRRQRAINFLPSFPSASRSCSEHRTTLATRHSLAYWSGVAGEATGARDQFAILLPIDERILGSEHPATLAARHELARWTGLPGMRPEPAISSPPSCPSTSGSWVPSTRTPWIPAPGSLTGPEKPENLLLFTRVHNDHVHRIPGATGQIMHRSSRTAGAPHFSQPPPLHSYGGRPRRQPGRTDSHRLPPVLRIRLMPDLDSARLSGGEFGGRFAMHEDGQFADVSEGRPFQMGTLWEHLYHARAIPPRPFRSR